MNLGKSVENLGGYDEKYNQVHMELNIFGIFHVPNKNFMLKYNFVIFGYFRSKVSNKTYMVTAFKHSRNALF